ncbi:MAG: hypothetical protein KKF56_05335 [Nanoarchaeota archaeon]|nr:hypothetical protein [Nanoarchaeota archaeon]
MAIDETEILESIEIEERHMSRCHWRDVAKTQIEGNHYQKCLHCEGEEYECFSYFPRFKVPN